MRGGRGLSPVNYFVLMEELQAEQHARRVEPEPRRWRCGDAASRKVNCAGLREGSGVFVCCSLRLFVAEDVVVDVGHEVAPGRVGHDEADVVGRLEAAVQVDQERMLRCVDHLEDPLFTHQAATQTRTTAAY